MGCNDNWKVAGTLPPTPSGINTVDNCEWLAIPSVFKLERMTLYVTLLNGMYSKYVNTLNRASLQLLDGLFTYHWQCWFQNQMFYHYKWWYCFLYSVSLLIMALIVMVEAVTKTSSPWCNRSFRSQCIEEDESWEEIEMGSFNLEW